jgi:hypothetical protein
MSVVSDEQMHRPLFEEPTPAIERQDALEAPLGFLIGGGANLSPQHLAQQYFDAASLLTETIRNGDLEDYRLANPVLYLYRHSIELFEGSDGERCAPPQPRQTGERIRSVREA